MPQTQTFIYALLKPWVRAGAKLFFSDIRILHPERLPLDRPVILVANHQNAMLDPVLICLFTKKQLHWLTRADVFKKPAVSAFLHKLNMLPVYRERDRVSDLADRNGKTFDICYDRLRSNAVVCLFPEGTHRGKKQLVLPLKKGSARMALNAAASGVKGLCILPVGLDYENYYDYRKSLIISFGEPIPVYASDNASERGRQQSEVTNQITQELRKLMIHIDTDDVYHEVIGLKPLFDKVSEAKNPAESFRLFKAVSDHLDNDAQHHEWLRKDVHHYLALGHDLHLQEEYYRPSLSFASRLITAISLVLSAPGYLFYYPIYFLTEKFVSQKVKDPLFRNSIRMTFWTFLTPIWMLLSALVLTLAGLNLSTTLFVCSGLILSGIIALKSLPHRKVMSQFFRSEKLRKANDSRYLEWLELRERIAGYLASMIQKKHV